MSPKPIAKPCDVYVRISDVRGREGDSYISPEVQEERCRAVLTARGLEVGEVFVEENISGKTMERPKLREALERIKAGQSGGIVGRRTTASPAA